MPTKRTRIDRHIIANVSLGALWVMGDEKLYPKPEQINDWELDFIPGYRHAQLHFDEIRAVWDECKESILQDWIKAYPGSRPSYWWLYDSPRMSAEDIERYGWQGWYYVPYLCEPRVRLGGIGTPNHEVLNYAPSFHCGIPDSGWITKSDADYYSRRNDGPYPGSTVDRRNELIKGSPFAGKPIDRRNPPRYEAQATYLERHGLLLPEEKRRVSAADLEPEVVVSEESEEESNNVIPWPASPGVQ